MEYADGNDECSGIYRYILNLQGDVVGLYDLTRDCMAMTYTYDAWGRELSWSTLNSGYAGLLYGNPLTYRGYIYDRETGFYYLQSRYYDPSVGRFLNADGYILTGPGIIGHNMFACCGNNPVNRVDPTGHFWSEIWEFTKTAITEIGKAMGGLSPAYAGCGGAAAIDGPLPFGDIVGIAGMALLTLGAIGQGIYQAVQAPAISVPKVEEKDVTVLPSSTVIYRYGGTNPGNLTPKAKDRYTGLSFSTVPKPGSAMTTIEALNATGFVYAVRDGATHVSVRPLCGTMTDWINAGSNSIWTRAIKSVVIKLGW